MHFPEAERSALTSGEEALLAHLPRRFILLKDEGQPARESQPARMKNEGHCTKVVCVQGGVKSGTLLKFHSCLGSSVSEAEKALLKVNTTVYQKLERGQVHNETQAPKHGPQVNCDILCFSLCDDCELPPRIIGPCLVLVNDDEMYQLLLKNSKAKGKAKDVTITTVKTLLKHAPGQSTETRTVTKGAENASKLHDYDASCENDHNPHHQQAGSSEDMMDLDGPIFGSRSQACDVVNAQEREMLMPDEASMSMRKPSFSAHHHHNHHHHEQQHQQQQQQPVIIAQEDSHNISSMHEHSARQPDDEFVPSAEHAEGYGHGHGEDDSKIYHVHKRQQLLEALQGAITRTCKQDAISAYHACIQAGICTSISDLPNDAFKNNNSVLHLAVGVFDDGDKFAGLNSYFSTSCHDKAHDESSCAMALWLLEQDADVNVCDKHGVTPLHLCAWSNLEQTAHVLLNHGATVNATANLWFSHDVSALHLASMRRNHSLFHLLSSQPRINTKLLWRAPHTFCIEEGGPVCCAECAEMWRAFSRGRTCKFRDHVCINALIFERDGFFCIPKSIKEALKIEDPTRLKAAIDAYICADEEQQSRREVLGILLLTASKSRSGRTECIDLLLDMQADVNFTKKMQNRGSTPIMNAANFGSREVVELLLRRGADVNAHTKSGMYVTHAASLGGNQETFDIVWPLVTAIPAKGPRMSRHWSCITDGVAGPDCRCDDCRNEWANVLNFKGRVCVDEEEDGHVCRNRLIFRQLKREGGSVAQSVDESRRSGVGIVRSVRCVCVVHI
jgi:hypothetical protein